MTPFLLPLAFALGWVAAHVVGEIVHAIRMRAPGAR